MCRNLWHALVRDQMSTGRPPVQAVFRGYWTTSERHKSYRVFRYCARRARGVILPVVERRHDTSAKCQGSVMSPLAPNPCFLSQLTYSPAACASTWGSMTDLSSSQGICVRHDRRQDGNFRRWVPSGFLQHDLRSVSSVPPHRYHRMSTRGPCAGMCVQSQSLSSYPIAAVWFNLAELQALHVHLSSSTLFECRYSSCLAPSTKQCRYRMECRSSLFLHQPYAAVSSAVAVNRREQPLFSKDYRPIKAVYMCTLTNR